MNILCIGTPAWDGDYIKSTVKLMTELASMHKVLYVEYAYTYSDVMKGILKRKDVPNERILKKNTRLRKIEVGAGKQIYVLTLPPLLPINFLKNEKLHSKVAAINADKAAKHINQALKTLDMAEVDWQINAFSPVLGTFLMGRFQEKKFAYYCYDEIGAATYLKKHGLRYEAQLLKKSDVLIFSSAALQNKKTPVGKAAFTIQNGVDAKQFFALKSTPKTTTQKVIGYLGSVDERLDFELLEKAILAQPECLFRFIGRENTRNHLFLKKYKNVEFLGPKTPETLPKLVADFDVCLIPFLINALTAGIYPMKINEYFALGKAVVSTRFGDMDDFEDLAFITDSEDKFLKALNKAIAETDTTKQSARKARANSNSWEKKGRQFSEVLSSFF